MDYIYDGWMNLFLASKHAPPVHYHYNAWKSQDIFKYISDCVCLKDESHIHLGCLEGE